MDRRYKWINEMVRQNNIKFEFTPTSQQKADGLTKPMNGKQFLTARNYLLGEVPSVVELSGVRGGDKSIAKNAWTLVRHASANEGTLGRDPLMQRERHLIKGNNAL
jgi:hypothetical protein